MVPRKVQRSNLVREKVLKDVRRDIATGALAPGSRLTERSLCQTHKVSRTVAREVIRQLEAERLGDVVPHKGLRIAQLTAELVRDIFEIRLALELQVALRFVEVATQAQVRKLQRLHGELKALEHSTRYVILARRTAALTDYMVKVTGKQTAGEILGHLNTRIIILRILSMKAPGQISRGIGLLGQLVSAIERRDSESVDRVLREYMRVAADSALRQLSTAGSVAAGPP